MIKRKFVVFTITSILLLTSYAALPVAGMKTGIETVSKNPWTPEDEGDHFPCGCEWWTFHVALELEDGTHWDVSATFQYETEPTNMSDLSQFLLLLYCFNRESGKMLDFTMGELKRITGKEIPFYFKKNVIDLEYHNCTMKGLYPNYTTHVEDDEKRFILDLSLSATSLPHWVAQEGSNGYFPWGLSGWTRYGFIPRLNASGNITIEGVKSNVTGVGYFEHAWGNFTYINTMEKPLSKLKEFIKNLQKTLPFLRWCLSEQSINFPKKLIFASDNIFGYDWTWAAFDNGWSLHLGIFHMMDCVAEGPVPGVLSLTPDGQTYWDFADINIKYGRRYYIEEADAYLPLDIEVTATKGDKILHLRFNTTTEPFIEVAIYPISGFFCGRGGMVTVGVVDGYYRDKEQNISLHGICAIGPYRQYLTTKHNSLKIEFLRPPQGLGFSIEIISHLLGFEMLFKRQLLPYPERHFYIKRCHDTSIAEPEPPSNNPNALCLYVGGDGPNNYTKIQDAIDNASTGDTVFVYNGTYYENVIVDKTIRLIGEDKNNVLINAGNSDGIKVIANNVEITGFTIDSEKADYWDDSAIDISSSGNLIHDNNIIKSEWYGIYVYNSSYNVIENNSIIDDDIGIWLCRSTNNIIRYNNITLSNWFGIWIWHSSRNNTIHCNNFIENKINIQNSDKYCKNKWDKNYWDDYPGLKFKRLVDLNNDGIGIIPYRIPRFNVDRHPMMEPYEI